MSERMTALFPLARLRAMRTGRALVSAVFVAIWAGRCLAGQIDPLLVESMSRVGADDVIRIVIRPAGTILGTQLKSDVVTQFATRAEQHRAVLSLLQETAKSSQKAILAAINSPDFQGRIQNVEGFWVDNVITAEATPSAIAELSQRADIDDILLYPPIELVTPLSAGTASEPGTIQNHIRAVKADSVWAAGYTGRGRLIASLDTGVDGKHVLLSSSWRGHNGGSLAESWHNPLSNDTVPRTFAGDGVAHGTEVMGLMVARRVPGLNDTISACPDCQWISAAAIDIPCSASPSVTCSNLFDALQWIADPDGDPNTDEDVPDAVANPWGAITVNSDGMGNCTPTSIGCSDIFWNAIDNIEAAGAMMVFAAGNEGDCGASSVRNPANRASSETNAFSVGMVDTRTNILTPPVDPLSSQGPSQCDGTSTKPELVAPGVNLRTTLPNDVISSSAYGTSFSTPLVAAGAALLREYNPNATVEQVKAALLAGAKDLGAPGPDNSYGHGLLDLMGALRALPANTKPAIYIKHDHYQVLPRPGGVGYYYCDLTKSL